MLLALALLAAAPLPDPFAHAIVRFSRTVALVGNKDSFEVLRYAKSRKRDAGYAMRLTRSAPGKPVQHLWADSRTCPAIAPVLTTMRAILPRPNAAPVLIDDGIMDGASYQLNVDAAWLGQGSGVVGVNGNIGTPLAKWMEASMDRLKPCWSRVQPRLAG